MKLVLSRKGFDSSYGGIPSPILPDGRLISLPIPSRVDAFTLANINYPDVDTGRLISDISKGSFSNTTRVHLDPDLARPTGMRMPQWRPALGQTGSAQSHLANKGIGIGDVFLFFGWFREVEHQNGRWNYRKGAPDLHILFGWLEVADVLPIVTDREAAIQKFPWIADHPHVASPDWYEDKLNTLYVASEKSRFCADSTFGAGRFKSNKAVLQLTKPGCSRSIWSLPKWFFPGERSPLSYHQNLLRWSLEENSLTLKSVAKGQEFVLDSVEYPELESWVSSVIQEGYR